ncbi:extensin-like [Lolium rigidum]|uniref:extensin-like n=1 Tax=Lolium rigidum TaxID=89674 RepID=UPI001F5D6FFF|nr:extensin-like [Lolium rigidum]
MASTPPPVIGKAGNLTVFITPPAARSPVDTPRSRSPQSPGSEFSTPNTTPRSLASPASPPPKQASPPPATVKTVSPPPPAKTVSPPLPAAKLFQPPPVQVPPPQFEKAEAKPDGSALAFFWDAVLRVQEAHASLDGYISNWFGLDQSKYQWALNDYYESTGKEMDLGKAGKPSDKMQKV